MDNRKPTRLVREFFALAALVLGTVTTLGGETANNPKVEPGKVRWHPTFQAACDAARQSGKPVLLFQMMGKLDDQFC